MDEQLKATQSNLLFKFQLFHHFVCLHSATKINEHVGRAFGGTIITFHPEYYAIIVVCHINALTFNDFS